MKKQALAIAIASALVAPSAFAAQDTSGMHYTSASEGFYASLRARLDFGSGDTTANIDENSSRIGIRGTNDLGGGLEGFYQWEGGVRIDAGGHLANDGDDDGTSAWRIRLGNVGLRGNFGEVVIGSFWPNDYNWTFGSTDVANNYSGYFIYNDDRVGRTSKAIQYSTPDLNGFQGAFRVQTEGSDADNDIDAWNLAANYAVQGFSVGGAYHVRPDSLTKYGADNFGTDSGEKDDANSWTFKLGYSQDNWYVNGWYGEDNTSDAGYNAGVHGITAAPGTPGTPATDTAAEVAATPARVARAAAAGTKAEDTTFFSIGGGVSVDKVNLYAAYDQRENSSKQEDSYGVIGAQYNLGSNSRVWVEYFSQDLDTNTDADDIVSLGLRHDF